MYFSRDSLHKSREIYIQIAGKIDTDRGKTNKNDGVSWCKGLQKSGKVRIFVAVSPDHSQKPVLRKKTRKTLTCAAVLCEHSFKGVAQVLYKQVCQSLPATLEQPTGLAAQLRKTKKTECKVKRMSSESSTKRMNSESSTKACLSNAESWLSSRNSNCLSNAESRLSSRDSNCLFRLRLSTYWSARTLPRCILFWQKLQKPRKPRNYVNPQQLTRQ